jgi:hypothetical protein
MKTRGRFIFWICDRVFWGVGMGSFRGLRFFQQTRGVVVDELAAVVGMLPQQRLMRRVDAQMVVSGKPQLAAAGPSFPLGSSCVRIRARESPYFGIER